MAHKQDDTGKQIFFLSFDQPFGDELITHLVRNEFEVYKIEDIYRLATYITVRGRAILCIPLQETVSILQWGKYIGGIQQQTEENPCDIILLTKPETAEELGTLFGINQELLHYIDISKTEDQLKGELQSLLGTLGAKGQRSYVRFGGTNQPNASFTFTHKGIEYSGIVHDISSAGMACAFEEETVFDIDDRIHEIKLHLDNREFLLEGKVFQKRWLDEVKRLFIVMFDRRLPQSVRWVLQDFIHSSLQAELEIRLKDLPSASIDLHSGE